MLVDVCQKTARHFCLPLSAVHSIIFTLQQTNRESLVQQAQYQPSRINYFLQSQLYNESLWEMEQLKKKMSHQQDGEEAALRPALFPPFSP